MPLKKLFKKRNNPKKMSAAQSANEDIDKLQSSMVPTAQNELELQTESILQTGDSNIPIASDIDIIEKTSNDISDKYEFLLQKEKTIDLLAARAVGSSDTRRSSTPAEVLGKFETSEFPSASCKEGHSSPERRASRRRKCVSESNSNSDKLERQNIDNEIIRLKSKELEDVIGRWVNKLISESIVAAVSNVKVDDICEEIMQNFSDRRLSENSDSVESYGSIEHRWPDSLAHYVELSDRKLHESTEINEENDHNSEGEESKIIVHGNAETPSLDGYQGDFEESISLHSIDSLTKFSSNVNQIGKPDYNKSDSTELNVQMQEAESKACKDVNEQQVVEIHDHRGDSDKSEELCSEKTESKTAEFTSEVNSENSIKQSPGKDNEYIDETQSIVNMESSTIKDTPTSCTQSATSDIDEEAATLPPSGVKLNEDPDLIMISSDNDLGNLLNMGKLNDMQPNESVIDSVENLSSQEVPKEEEKKINWKVGYLHVKLPHKTRSKGHLKAWKKRCVSIQPDEFANDPKNPSLMMSVYSAESSSARKHSASFWKSISCQKAVVYRSSSSSQRYAFTISDDSKVVIHLASDSEAVSQEWMAAIRSIFWPPSPVMQLEKMLNGKQFEISIIDNDFAFRAGLLGMYGYLNITPKKLILVHPQQGYVIQEWYLNTVDKFELMPQSKIEDVHKVLAMTTCSDSSTGKGEILMFCTEAVTVLQAIALTIHQILTEHSVQEGGKYQKELAEMADWLGPATTENTDDQEDYYKVPPRQVKSLLDIPNFIFNKPLTPVATIACGANESMETVTSLESLKSNPTRTSQDSGISTENTSEDFLNCSITSFVIGSGAFPGKSSDSEFSDSYTPPRSPEVRTKQDGIEKMDATVTTT